MTTETSDAFRGAELLHAETSRLVMIDVQEKLVQLLPDPPRLIAACRMLIEGARLFNVPICMTEQYPQGLGPTTGALASLVPDRIAKMEFSAVSCLNWPTAAEDATGRFQIVLAGIEAHVCVLQTALELQSAGYRVFVAGDAVASRRDSDRDLAFQRMTASGITLISAESALFEWCERSDRAEFKTVSKLIKERPLD